jgi:multiple sugar transport system permease protein
MANIFSRKRLVRFPILRFVTLVVLSLIWSMPLLWMLATALKPEAQTITTPPSWFPKQLSDFTLDNFISVLFFGRGIDLLKAFGNSVFMALTGTVLVVIVDALAGYAFARLRFPGRNTLFALVIASLVVPAEILLIPNYVTVWHFGWLNSVTALVIPPLAGGFGVFLLRQFMLGIPRELEEAAQIDGAGLLRIFTMVVVPLSRGAIATLAIFTYLALWNEFTWPYLVINDAERMTLPIALIQFKGDYASNYGQLMAGAAISALPAILIFLLAQRMIIRSITLTGIKG